MAYLCDPSANFPGLGLGKTYRTDVDDSSNQ